MNNRLQRLDYFFLMRPVLFIPGWATLIVGYMTAQLGMPVFRFSNFMDAHVAWWNAQLALALLTFSCAMGGSFILNQLQDIATDKKNNKLFLLGNGFVSNRAGYIESFLLIIFSLVLALTINFKFFLFIFCFTLLTGYLYNFPPFLFKDKPIAGLFANMAMGWLAFAMGWVIAKPISMNLLINSLPVLFFNTSLYFLTTIPDMTGDGKSGKITFPIKYGQKFTVLFCFFFFILALLSSYWLKHDFMLIVSMLTLPFMIYLVWKQNKASALIAVKAGIAAFALMICLKLPGFFLLLAVLYFSTRYYYKNRFDYSYPNFKGR